MLVDSTKNEEVILLFDKTPFYAEAGGPPKWIQEIYKF